MNRQKILNQYDVYEENPVVIKSPGKFEGETIWVPYFYGQAPSEDEIYSPIEERILCEAFIITGFDTDQFPELKNEVGKVIVLHYDSQGFVRGEIGTVKEWENFKARLEAEFEEWEKDQKEYDDCGLSLI